MRASFRISVLLLLLLLLLILFLILIFILILIFFLFRLLLPRSGHAERVRVGQQTFSFWLRPGRVRKQPKVTWPTGPLAKSPGTSVYRKKSARMLVHPCFPDGASPRPHGSPQT
jgi:hypothetical protein